MIIYLNLKKMLFLKEKQITICHKEKIILYLLIKINFNKYKNKLMISINKKHKIK